MEIIPAILEKDFASLQKLLDAYSKVSVCAQVDVCDGVFVPRKTWLPSSGDDLSGYFLDLEFDMMVKDVRNYLGVLFYYDAKKIIIHTRDLSTQEYVEIYKYIKNSNTLISVGVCDTEENKIRDMYPHFDYVQVMGIDKVGEQGSEFSAGALMKVKSIKNILLELGAGENIYIQVDGGVNDTNILEIKQAGATSCAVGSYLKSALERDELKEAYQGLRVAY